MVFGVVEDRFNAKFPQRIFAVLCQGLGVGDGIKAERQFAAGEITVQQREVAHAKNAASMAGGWAGAWAGAELGAFGGGAAGTAVVPGLGTTIGAVGGGIAGGIGGYIGGESAAGAATEWVVGKLHDKGTTITGTAKTAAMHLCTNLSVKATNSRTALAAVSDDCQALREPGLAPKRLIKKNCRACVAQIPINTP